MDEYVTSLLPGTETSVSMVRDVRARLYEDDSALLRTDVENIPVKLDVETLYILEQKSNRTSLSDYEHNSLSGTTQHDFAMQTTTPTSSTKPQQRPIGTQVNSTIEQHTVSAQTTDSLHHPTKERQRLPSPLPPPPPLSSSSSDEEGERSKIIRTTTTTTRYEVKRRHSSHRTSEDEGDGDGSISIYIDDKENFESKSHIEQVPVVSEQRSSFSQVTSCSGTQQVRDTNRFVDRRHLQQTDFDEEEHRSSEVYEIHTRGACKCLVVSYEEKTQYGSETRFEKQLKRIERTYTEDELKATELHVIVTSSDGDYQLVRRDYGLNKTDDDDNTRDNDGRSKHPTITIHYYTKEGHRMRTEQARRLEHLPLFVRCEIEYELNHYGMLRKIFFFLYIYSI